MLLNLGVSIRICLNTLGLNVDYKDLGFFDPSGGPFISEGFEFHGMKVKRIFVEEGKIFVEVY